MLTKAHFIIKNRKRNSIFSKIINLYEWPEKKSTIKRWFCEFNENYVRHQKRGKKMCILTCGLRRLHIASRIEFPFGNKTNFYASQHHHIQLFPLYEHAHCVSMWMQTMDNWVKWRRDQMKLLFFGMFVKRIRDIFSSSSGTWSVNWKSESKSCKWIIQLVVVKK